MVELSVTQVLIVVGMVFILVVVVTTLAMWARRLRRALSAERSGRQSQSTRYGQMTEQFLPLVESYPYDSSNFRFLGSPIDGVQFEEDRVILMEFKSGNSQLTSKQRRIRDMVAEGKVEFQVVRVG